MSSFKLASVEEAIDDFKKGKFVIVVDDEDRENEGDLILAAELATPEHVNFMLRTAVVCFALLLQSNVAINLDWNIKCRLTPACWALRSP